MLSGRSPYVLYTFGMGNKKKVLIVVLALDAEPWRSIEELGQRGTWAGADANIPILWLHGLNRGPARALVRVVSKILTKARARVPLGKFRHAVGKWAAGRGTVINGRQLLTRVPETYITTNAKTVAAFRHLLLTEDFDYILRTNSSTYVNLHKLEEFVQTIPDTGYYGGTLWRSHGIEYATGTSILLSRDLVDYAAHDPRWEFDHIDDVALGKSMARAGVTVDPFTRIDVYTAAALAKLTVDDLKSVIVVRCKGVEERGHDITAMHRIHALYGN